MKKLLFCLNNPLVICGIGAAILGYGELKGAIWDGDKAGGTLSELFKAQPLWVKLFIFIIIGAICCHLAEWRIRDTVTINAEKIESLTVEEQHAKPNA